MPRGRWAGRRWPQDDRPRAWTRPARGYPSAFDAIWRVAEPRPVALRLLVYWTLLTLGPLLVGASISVSTYAFAAVQWAGIDGSTKPLFSLAWLLPIALSAILVALVVATFLAGLAAGYRFWGSVSERWRSWSSSSRA